MTDANRELEELARITQRVHEEMAIYGEVSAQTQQRQFDAQVKNATGLQNATAGLGAMGDVLVALKSAAMAATKAMTLGAKGASAMNGAMDSVVTAAKMAAVALTLLVPGGPLIKLVVGGLSALAVSALETSVELQKMANELGDRLFKSYQDISKSGAAAADGMGGLLKTSQQLGLTMDELGGLVTAVAANSKDLALFAGSVSEGRKQLGDMGAALEGNRAEFLRMGMTMTDVTEGQLGYLQLQTRLGNSQKMTTAQLATGARAYLIEQDALTKLTGQSRKDMEADRDRAMQGEQFAAKIREMQLNGQGKQAEELMKMNAIYSAAGPKMASAFQASVTGNLSNVDAQEANLASNGAMIETTQKVIAGQMSYTDAVGLTGRAMGKTADEVGTVLGQFSAYNSSFGPINEQLKLAQLAQGDITAKMVAIKADQDKLLKGGSDKMLEYMTQLTQLQIKEFQAMQAAALGRLGSSVDMNILLMKMARLAGEALEKLSEVAMDLYRGMRKFWAWMSNLDMFTSDEKKASNKRIETQDLKDDIARNQKIAKGPAVTDDQKLAVSNATNQIRLDEEKLKQLAQEQVVLDLKAENTGKQEKHMKNEAELAAAMKKKIHDDHQKALKEFAATGGKKGMDMVGQGGYRQAGQLEIDKNATREQQEYQQAAYEKLKAAMDEAGKLQISGAKYIEERLRAADATRTERTQFGPLAPGAAAAPAATPAATTAATPKTPAATTAATTNTPAPTPAQVVADATAAARANMAATTGKPAPAPAAAPAAAKLPAGETDAQARLRIDRTNEGREDARIESKAQATGKEKYYINKREVSKEEHDAEVKRQNSTMDAARNLKATDMLPGAPASPTAPTAPTAPAEEKAWWQKSIFAKAEGGPVTAKSPYLVGEKGPELFIPSAAGNILSNPKMKSVMDGINSSLDALGSNVNKTSSTDTTVGNINAGIVKKFEQLSKITSLDVDRAGNYSVRYKQLVDDNTTLQDNTLKDATRIEKATKIDANLADKYSLAFKSYMEIKTQLMEIETPMLQKQIDQVMNESAQGVNTSGGAAGGSGGGGGLMSKIKSFFGGGGSGLKLPAAGSMPSMGGGQGLSGGKGSQDDLTKMGLKLKTGDTQAENSKVNSKIIEMAQQVQSNIPGFAYFSAFNDKFHQEKAPGSSHTAGNAMDFTLARPPSVEDGAEITKWLKSMGANVAIDEYNNPSSKSTAGHIHAQIAGYADGGIANTPQIAMVAEKGPEAMIPLVDGAIPIKMDMSGYTSAIDKVVQTISLNKADYAEGGKFADGTGGWGKGGKGMTAFGVNEWTGFQSGASSGSDPLGTDLKALKDIAAQLGAFDKATQIITDPATWKQILNSGIATNYDLGPAKVGLTMNHSNLPLGESTKNDAPGIGEDIGNWVKKFKEADGLDTTTALNKVIAELRTVMQESIKNTQAEYQADYKEGGGSGDPAKDTIMMLATMIDTMGEMVRAQKTSNDIQQKILSNAM